WASPCKCPTTSPARRTRRPRACSSIPSGSPAGFTWPRNGRACRAARARRGRRVAGEGGRGGREGDRRAGGGLGGGAAGRRGARAAVRRGDGRARVRTVRGPAERRRTGRGGREVPRTSGRGRPTRTLSFQVVFGA